MQKQQTADREKNKRKTSKSRGVVNKATIRNQKSTLDINTKSGNEQKEDTSKRCGMGKNKAINYCGKWADIKQRIIQGIKTVCTNLRSFRSQYAFNFFVFFLLGNFLIGIFESFAFEETYRYVTLNKENLNFCGRFLLIFGPASILLIGIIYLIFSFLFLCKYKYCLICLIFFYCWCLFTILFQNHSSPISLLGGYVYQEIF